jgi:integrase/recombinase XerC
VTVIRVAHVAGRAQVCGARADSQACARFLARLETRGLSVHTRQAYAYDLALIYRWLSSAKLRLERLNTAHVPLFLAWERGRASRPKSINRRLHTMRLFYRFVLDKEMPGGTEQGGRLRSHYRDRELGLQRLAHAPIRQLRVKEPRTLVEPLTIEQVRTLLANLRRYRDIAIAHLMLLCGLRCLEVIQLRLGDLDFEDRRIRVKGKGGKERALPLPTLLVDLIRRYIALERPVSCSCESLFVVLQGCRRGQTLSRPGITSIFRTRRLRPALANANPHRLRHTFGTDMARSGVRLPILQRMMGHAYPETTLQYVNLSMADVALEFHRAVQLLEARYLEDRGSSR